MKCCYIITTVYILSYSEIYTPITYIGLLLSPLFTYRKSSVLTTTPLSHWWLGGVVVKTLDLRVSRRWFESR